MIEVTGLTKRYGRTTVVNNLTFTVRRGEIIGFLGPNGAGKSTTMNMLTGYTAPTVGTVRINGYNLLDAPEKAKTAIGSLFGGGLMQSVFSFTEHASPQNWK